MNIEFKSRSERRYFDKRDVGKFFYSQSKDELFQIIAGGNLFLLSLKTGEVTASLKEGISDFSHEEGLVEVLILDISIEEKV